MMYSTRQVPVYPEGQLRIGWTSLRRTLVGLIRCVGRTQLTGGAIGFTENLLSAKLRASGSLWIDEAFFFFFGSVYVTSSLAADASHAAGLDFVQNGPSS